MIELYNHIKSIFLLISFLPIFFKYNFIGKSICLKKLHVYLVIRLFTPFFIAGIYSCMSYIYNLYNIFCILYVYYICIYMYTYIHIYIYIHTRTHTHIHVFRPAQDSSVWLGLTSREQLMSPECSKH